MDASRDDKNADVRRQRALTEERVQLLERLEAWLEAPMVVLAFAGRVAAAPHLACSNTSRPRCLANLAIQPTSCSNRSLLHTLLGSA